NKQRHQGCERYLIGAHSLASGLLRVKPVKLNLGPQLSGLFDGVLAIERFDIADRVLFLPSELLILQDPTCLTGGKQTDEESAHRWIVVVLLTFRQYQCFT